MKYKIEDLFDLQMGRTPERNNPEYWKNGVHKWIAIGDMPQNQKYIENTAESISDIAVKETKIPVIPANTVIMSFKLSVGKAAITTAPIYSNEAIMAFKDKHTVELMTDYIYYLLSCQKWSDVVNNAAKGKTLNKAILSQYEVNIHSIEEQRKIIAELDMITAAINECEHQIKLYNELVKSRFVEMFGGIHNSTKYPYRNVRDFSDVVSGGTPNREKTEYWENGEIPWIKTTELQNGIIDCAEEYITEKGLSESSAKLVPANTILVAMYGQGKTRGMTGLLGIEACTNQACACILPSNEINCIYLWKYFVFSYDNLRNLAKGGNQPNLNGNIIKNFPVLFPPLTLQEQFSDFVTKTDKSKVEIQKRIDLYTELLNKKMNEYFG